ncbi:TetR/AcrR family transcriptional regulator [Caballeronia sp. GACF4]|uniref:TetR/AcrR family transcriptional regulator n=1 Tax=Caballeronia sp. GACF4 TaxID=2921763 RepID=UPI002028CD06|nr:TetR/AcrR family transcriptional regulator [Caballeronia sp. GACF4]
MSTISRMDLPRHISTPPGKARELRQEQRDALRGRILDVSRAIVKREGFAALSMRRLAQAIDYSPAALYLHFRSRADIAHALCVEGHATLRAAFAPQASIADPAARLRAMARVYVEFGLAEPETYRLMFMDADRRGDGTHGTDDGMAALSSMTDAFVELRAAGRLKRLPPETLPADCAQALRATLHGIVALALCGVSRAMAADEILELSLDAWLA